MSKISVTTIAGLTSGGDANKVKIESGDTLQVESNATVGGTLGVTGAATLSGTLGVDGHSSIGNSTTVAGTRALTVVGASDGSGSEILNCYNSSLASKFSVRDDGIINAANLILAPTGIRIGGTATGNTLDDYEEGTWTATAGTGAGTLQSGAGVYTKIGRVVYVSAYLEFTGASTGGNRTYGGLPFPVLNHISASSVDFQGLAWSNQSAGYLCFDGGTSNFVNNHQKTFQGSFTANDYTRIQGFYFTT